MTDTDTHLFHDAAELRLAIFRAARRLRAERAVDTLSDAQLAVLSVLAHHGPLPPGELATRERVSAPSMNRTVNCLESDGYVTRRADDEDRRKVLVSITESGARVVDENKRIRTHWLAEALQQLPPDDRQTLLAASEVLNRVAEL